MHPQPLPCFPYFTTKCTNMLKTLHVCFNVVKHVDFVWPSFVANLAGVGDLVVNPSHGNIFLDQVVKFLIYNKVCFIKRVANKTETVIYWQTIVFLQKECNHIFLLCCSYMWHLSAFLLLTFFPHWGQAWLKPGKWDSVCLLILALSLCDFWQILQVHSFVTKLFSIDSAINMSCSETCPYVMLSL